MSKYNSSSPLSGVTFEDVMSEVEISSDEENRANTSSKGTVSCRSKSSNTAIEFNIVINYGKLSEKKSAVTFTLVDWNGYERYDLRGWSEDYKTPYKGISFTKDEISVLRDKLSCYTYRTYNEPIYVYDMGKTKVKIYDDICKLSSSTVQNIVWNKQVSIVDWGYGQKFDFRKWTECYDRCSKGVCLSKDEVYKLLGILKSLEL